MVGIGYKKTRPSSQWHIVNLPSHEPIERKFGHFPERCGGSVDCGFVAHSMHCCVRMFAWIGQWNCVGGSRKIACGNSLQAVRQIHILRDPMRRKPTLCRKKLSIRQPWTFGCGEFSLCSRHRPPGCFNAVEQLSRLPPSTRARNEPNAFNRKPDWTYILSCPNVEWLMATATDTDLDKERTRPARHESDLSKFWQRQTGVEFVFEHSTWVVLVQYFGLPLVGQRNGGWQINAFSVYAPFGEIMERGMANKYV